VLAAYRAETLHPTRPRFVLRAATKMDISQKLYDNDGNSAVVGLVPQSARTVLDVGCGAGANARLLLQRNADTHIFGLTGSPSEAERARATMRACWVVDLERELPSEVAAMTFDCIVMSHVLEHLTRPEQLVARCAALLKPGGTCVIAVPNVLNWRDRLAFARGHFEYRDGGTLDSTHLRFYTYETAARLLLAEAPELSLAGQGVTGSVPLWVLRHHILTAAARAKLDRWGCARWPNLFGSEVLLRAERRR
jgi:2-polyprenyl-3-methyl-5-hydroxy-6-metoxy-1,4-benzoquinol methylase